MKQPEVSRRLFLGATAATAATATLMPTVMSDRAEAAPSGYTLEKLEGVLAKASPPFFLLETQVPDQFSTSLEAKLSISDKHAKLGQHSLQWDFEAGSALTVATEPKLNPARYDPNRKLPGSSVSHFAVWVYNEKAIDDVVRFEFRTDEHADCWFDFHLNFTGWRTAWIRYGWDTEGSLTKTINNIKIKAPKSAGTLWFDQFFPHTTNRGDHATPDFQVPQVQDGIEANANYHWLGVQNYWKRLETPGFNNAPASKAELSAAKKIRQRLLDDLTKPVAFDSAALDELEKRMDDLGISALADPDASGAALQPAAPGAFAMGYQDEVWPGQLKKLLSTLAPVTAVRKMMDAAHDAAQAWVNAHNAGDQSAAKRAGELYLRALVYLFDQGWIVGSSQGTTHHLGYQFRGWAISVLLAEPLLRERELFDRARDSVVWYAGTGRLNHDFSDTSHLSGLMDVLNTIVNALLISAVLPDTPQERVARLRAFGDWINHACKPTPGLSGGFKPDSTLYHHMGMYMAYGRDALIGSVPVLSRVGQTPFALKPDNARIVRGAVLLQRQISNTYNFPFSMSGRHPNGHDGLDKGLTSLVDVFGVLADSPLGDKPGPDREMAAAYRRLLPPDATAEQKALDQKFARAGIKPEYGPHGYFQYGYGQAAQARQNKWSVIVRGHNRYQWTAEIYKDQNLYGRYLTYGQIEVTSKADANGVISHDSNGKAQPGLDWRHLPGTTTLQIPMDELREDMSKKSSVMPMPENAFGGGGAMANHAAIFGMDLKESPLFNASHRARISAFLVGNRVYALGSAINNDDTKNATHTTLFQISPDTMYRPQQLRTAETWAVDPANNGYVVLEGKLLTETKQQTNPDESGKQQGTHTFSTGWLDHGKAPKDAGYAYVLLVDGGAEETKTFAADTAAQVQVLQRDNDAHVVLDKASGITAYTVFNAEAALKSDSRVLKTSRPALVLERPYQLAGAEPSAIAYSVTDPDLHLFEGKDKDQYDPNTGAYRGNQGPFSRPWRFNDSPETTTTLNVRGKWRLASGAPAGVTTQVKGEDTVVTVRAQHAKSQEFTLVREGLPDPKPEQPSQPEQPDQPTPAPSNPSQPDLPAPAQPGQPGPSQPSQPTPPAPAPSGGSNPAPAPNANPAPTANPTPAPNGNGTRILPRTGAEVGGIAAIGAALLAGGAAAKHRSNRAKQQSAGAEAVAAQAADTEVLPVVKDNPAEDVQ